MCATRSATSTDTPTSSTSHENVSQLHNSGDIIAAVSEILIQLERDNFGSGVNFCPPHFIDHKFYTGEKANIYSGECGLIRDYHGKIWEELNFHALRENLPCLIGDTQIQCVWVFHGLSYARDSKLFDVHLEEQDYQLDLLLIGMTNDSKIFIIPIEVKAMSDSNRDNGMQNKAIEQSEKHVKMLNQFNKLLASELETDVAVNDFVICPVVFFCHTSSGTVELTDFWQEANDLKIHCFNIHYNDYMTAFVSQQKNNILLKLFDEVTNKTKSSVVVGQKTFETMVCLYTAVAGFKLTSKTSRQHDKQICMKHLELVSQKRPVCVKGTFLCPKQIHDYVMRTIGTLKYLDTFAKCRSDQEQPLAINIEKLPQHIARYARKFSFSYITIEQKTALESNDTHVAICGDYGAGKTLILLFKAMMILYNITLKNSQFHRIHFITTKNALYNLIKPKFQKFFGSAILKQYVNFVAWEDFDGLPKIKRNGEGVPICDGAPEILFLDELWDIININCVNAFGRSIDRVDLFSRPCWFTVARKNNLVNEIRAILPSIKVFDLSWQLRGSHGVTYFDQCFKSTTSNSQLLHYPINGARSRLFEVPSTSVCDSVDKEVKYWTNQMMQGTMLLCSALSHATNANLKATLHRDWYTDNGRRYFPASCESVGIRKSFNRKITLYFCNLVDLKESLASLEYDVVIIVSNNLYIHHVVHSTIVSRAKYGITWILNNCKPSASADYNFCGCKSNDIAAQSYYWNKALENMALWGRCHVERTIPTVQMTDCGPDMTHWIGNLCQNPIAVSVKLVRCPTSTVTTSELIAKDPAHPLIKWIVTLEETSQGTMLQIGEPIFEPCAIGLPSWEMLTYSVLFKTESQSYLFKEYMPNTPLRLRPTKQLWKQAHIFLKAFPVHTRLFWKLVNGKSSLLNVNLRFPEHLETQNSDPLICYQYNHVVIPSFTSGEFNFKINVKWSGPDEQQLKLTVKEGIDDPIEDFFHATTPKQNLIVVVRVYYRKDQLVKLIWKTCLQENVWFKKNQCGEIEITLFDGSVISDVVESLLPNVPTNKTRDELLQMIPLEIHLDLDYNKRDLKNRATEMFGHCGIML